MSATREQSERAVTPPLTQPIPPAQVVGKVGLNPFFGRAGGEAEFDRSAMINDATFRASADAFNPDDSRTLGLLTENRRRAERQTTDGEVVIAWIGAVRETGRYRLVDHSDAGYRIESALPMLPGMVGMVRRLLPEGTKRNDAVCVAWCRPRGSDGFGFSIGLRRLES